MEYKTAIGKKFTLIIARGPEEVGARAADIVMELVGKGRPGVLCFPTGSTPIPLYRRLAGLYRKGLVSFRNCKAFTLDEYRGLPSSNKNSFRFYMERHLFSKTDFPPRAIHSFNGMAEDIEMECRKYEEAINKAGGISLLFLGIGANGHIAYNEPGSNQCSRTRMVVLSQETRRAIQKNFPGKYPPQYAFTLGIATILSAKTIVLMATGRDKARAIFRALKGKPTSDVPASFLQSFKGRLIVILDRDASSMLNVDLNRCQTISRK